MSNGDKTLTCGIHGDTKPPWEECHRELHLKFTVKNPWDLGAWTKEEERLN